MRIDLTEQLWDMLNWQQDRHYGLGVGDEVYLTPRYYPVHNICIIPILLQNGRKAFVFTNNGKCVEGVHVIADEYKTAGIFCYNMDKDKLYMDVPQVNRGMILQVTGEGAEHYLPRPD